MKVTFRTRSLLIAALLSAGLTAALAGQNGTAEWPQWRGPSRAASVSFSAPASWPESLTLKWKIDVGLGYATPLLVGDRVFLFSRQNGDEVMSALDLAGGKVIWRTGYPVSFAMHSGATGHGQGPKSTPVFADGRIYSIGMTGVVTAFDAATGRRLWQKPGSSVVPL